jgi:hypothetical protein
MNPTPAMLVIDENRWRFADLIEGGVRFESVEVDEDAGEDDRLERQVDELAARVAGRPVLVVAMPSAKCLSAVVSTDDLERGNRRRALGYRLEEHLPVAAEQAVADYCECRSDALGVCIEFEPLKPAIDMLEDRSFAVRHIVPLAMLIGAEVVTRHRDLDAILILNEDDQGSVDLIELDADKPTRWHWLVDSGDELRVQIETLATQSDGPPKVGVVGEGAAKQKIADDERFQCVVIEDPPGDIAMQQVQRLVDGKASPWFDLRHGALARPDQFELYRGVVLTLVVALVLFLAAVIGVTQYRGNQYADIATAKQAEEVALFKQALPDQRVPVNIKSRLQSEARKLAGLSGRGADGMDLSSLRETSAVVHLHALLASLPRDLRFRILDLSLQPDQMRVTGEARSHGDAEKIVGALRDTGRYEVDPPRTQALRDEDGVSFSFSATPIDPADLAKAGQR